MPLLFWAAWPRIVMLAAIGMFAAPFAPFEIMHNIAIGDYPPRLTRDA